MAINKEGGGREEKRRGETEGDGGERGYRR